jgi:hypothetical protein
MDNSDIGHMAQADALEPEEIEAVGNSPRRVLTAVLAALAVLAAFAYFSAIPAPMDCASIVDADRRLQCYDASADGAEVPARSAIAPRLN